MWGVEENIILHSNKIGLGQTMNIQSLSEAVSGTYHACNYCRYVRTPVTTVDMYVHL